MRDIIYEIAERIADELVNSQEHKDKLKLEQDNRDAFKVRKPNCHIQIGSSWIGYVNDAVRHKNAIIKIGDKFYTRNLWSECMFEEVEVIDMELVKLDMVKIKP